MKKIKYQKLVARGMDGPRIRTERAGPSRYRVYFKYFMQPEIHLGLVQRLNDAWSGWADGDQFIMPHGKIAVVHNVRTRALAIQALMGAVNA